MKTKIIAALKTAYATLGLSDEAFDGVASLLEKTVTEESQIATAVGGDDVKNLLKTIQGQVDSWKNKYHDTNKALETYKKAHPETNVEKKTEEENGGGGETEMSKLLKQMEALSARLDARDNADRNASVRKNVEEALKKAGCNNAGILEITLTNFALGDKESEEDAVKRLQAKYNTTAKSVFGDGPIPPIGGTTPQGDGYKPGAFSGFRKSLEDRGMKPKEEAKK